MVEARAIVEGYSCGKCRKTYKLESEAQKCCEKKKVDWTKVTEFELKQVHLDLFKEMYVDWDTCEFGAPRIDPKRPYGDSDVFESIGKIIKLKKKNNWDYNEGNWDESATNMMEDLHRQMETALQIVLCCHSFKLGWYVRDDDCDYQAWKYHGITKL